MDERLKFVARVLDGEKIAALCREFGISRKSGHKIISRYNDSGLEGLTDRSRRPYRHANQLPFQIEKLIVRTKQDKEGELNRLYEAIEPDYLKDKRRFKEIEKQLEEVLVDEKIKSLFDEYAVLGWSDHCVQQTVFFHLGFAAAMRLAGTIAPPPKLRAVG